MPLIFMRHAAFAITAFFAMPLFRYMPSAFRRAIFAIDVLRCLLPCCCQRRRYALFFAADMLHVCRCHSATVVYALLNAIRYYCC